MIKSAVVLAGGRAERRVAGGAVPGNNGLVNGEMVRVVILIFAAVIMLGLLPVRSAHAQQQQPSSGEQVVVCMIKLEHADAENLAAVLKPFLSPQGSIAAYAPTNTLIIKDRASIVDMLAEIIKGKPCTTDAPPPHGNTNPGFDKGLP
ncbi:MAG: secretin N-terminal domain-containing protein [Desulfobacterales bacterium]|jgi:type II secretory pathway component GspD/PulD (secretin)